MKNLGFVLLGIWLILQGVIPLINLSFEGLSLLVNILAIVAGVLVLVKR